MSLRLPARHRLRSTGPVDEVEHYYQPVLGWIMRRRLHWLLELLPSQPMDRMLEVGCGSGVFQYELGHRARTSVALDLHPHAAEVRDLLRADGVESLLLRADGQSLPFADDSFDAVVIVSAMEFMPDPERCLEECRRVLTRGGRLVLLTPRRLLWADLAWKLLSGWNAENDFQGGRERVQQAVERCLPDARRLRRPALLPAFLAPYEVVSYES